MTRRRPPARRRGTPLPTSPLKGGRREEKGGGEKAAAVRFLVRRRGRSRVLPVALLPPGRGEAGWGVDPGSADRAGESPDRLHTPAARPAEGVSMAETAALQTPGAPACRCRTPLPTSPLKGGRREGDGHRKVPRNSKCDYPGPATRRATRLLPQGNRIQESANGGRIFPALPGERSFLERTPRRRPRRTITDYPGQRRAENTPRITPPSAATRRKSLKTRGLPKPLRTRAHRPDGPRAARKADHGPRDNFRPAAGRGRPKAWRGWGFRAGGAARTRAPGSPRKRFRGITSRGGAVTLCG